MASNPIQQKRNRGFLYCTPKGWSATHTRQWHARRVLFTFFLVEPCRIELWLSEHKSRFLKWVIQPHYINNVQRFWTWTRVHLSVLVGGRWRLSMALSIRLTCCLDQAPPFKPFTTEICAASRNSQCGRCITKRGQQQCFGGHFENNKKKELRVLFYFKYLWSQLNK